MDNDNAPAGGGQGNNFFSGFLLGALVGAAIVFLFGTKKGKKLLEIISREGIGNISNILDETNKIEKLQEEAGQAEKEKTINVEKVKLSNREKIPVEIVRPKIRRFFRGISRHVN